MAGFDVPLPGGFYLPHDMQVTELPAAVQAAGGTEPRGNEPLAAHPLQSDDPATPASPKTQLRLF
jgi:hypothetical protein